jgi:hypothetical protein
MRLRIHNPTNEHTKSYRDYNIFWDELTNELKKTHVVTENRYFSNAHFERYIVKFDSLTHPYGIPLMECENCGNMWDGAAQCNCWGLNFYEEEEETV